MSNPQPPPGFGSDPTDGRAFLDWKSKYEPEARKAIRAEAWYLGILLGAVPIVMLLLWLAYVKGWFGIQDERYSAIVKYGVAWLGGTLGGTLFDLKWLYHVVARQLWHSDRRLWRIFTPHISGGLSFAVVALVSSGVIRLFDTAAVESLPLIAGMAFLVGYFSDSAIAKLSEVAETLFGPSRSKEQHYGSPDGKH